MRHQALPYRSVALEELFRGLFFRVRFIHTGMDYAALPNIEVYLLEGPDLESPIREAWFAVKQAGE